MTLDNNLPVGKVTIEGTFLRSSICTGSNFIQGQTASSPPSTGGDERQTCCASIDNISAGKKIQQTSHFPQHMHRNTSIKTASCVRVQPPSSLILVLILILPLATTAIRPAYTHQLYTPSTCQIGLYFVRLPSILLPDCPVPTSPVPDSAASSAPW